MFCVLVTTDRNWFEKGGVAFAGKLGGGMEVVLVTHVVAFPELLVTTCCLVMLLLWLEAKNTCKNNVLLLQNKCKKILLKKHT